MNRREFFGVALMGWLATLLPWKKKEPNLLPNDDFNEWSDPTATTITVDTAALCVGDLALNPRTRERVCMRSGVFNVNSGEQYYKLIRGIGGPAKNLKVRDELVNITGERYGQVARITSFKHPGLSFWRPPW